MITNKLLNRKPDCLSPGVIFFFFPLGIGCVCVCVCVCVHACSVAQSCLTIWDPVDCSPPAPLSMGFSRQECWSGLPCPSPGELPDQGSKPHPLWPIGHIGIGHIPIGRQVLHYYVQWYFCVYGFCISYLINLGIHNRGCRLNCTIL